MSESGFIVSDYAVPTCYMVGSIHVAGSELHVGLHATFLKQIQQGGRHDYWVLFVGSGDMFFGADGCLYVFLWATDGDKRFLLFCGETDTLHVYLEYG